MHHSDVRYDGLRTRLAMPPTKDRLFMLPHAQWICRMLRPVARAHSSVRSVTTYAAERRASGAAESRSVAEAVGGRLQAWVRPGLNLQDPEGSLL